MPNYSTEQVADMLGITARAVRAAAKKMGIGEPLARDRVYTDADVERLRHRKTTPGPAKRAPADARDGRGE